MLRPGDPSGLLHVPVAQHHTLRFDGARRQRVHTHAVAGVVGRHGFSELDQRALGRAVGGASSRADMAKLGGHMDDDAAAARDHGRQNGAAHQIGAFDVDRENVVPTLRGKIEDAGRRVVGGSAVDQNIRPAPARFDLIRGRLRRQPE